MATSVDLPDGLERGIEAELQDGVYTSKSELIKDAVRRLLEEHGRIREQNLSEKARHGITAARESDNWVPHDDVTEQMG